MTDIKGKGKARDVSQSEMQREVAKSIEQSSLTYNETVDAILQFLEAAFHTILRLRGVYPLEIFKLHRLYSLPVYRSRHPGLNEYITGLLSAIRLEFLSSKLRTITLLVSTATTGVPLERYVFELDFLLPELRSSDRDLSIRDNLTFQEVQLVFRAFMMKLNALDASLEEIATVKEELTFAIVLEMKQGHKPGLDGADDNTANHPAQGPWVPFGVSSSSESTDQQPVARRSAAGQEHDADGAIFVPVRSFDSGVINLNLHVEDNLERKAMLRNADKQVRTPQRRPRHRQPSGPGSDAAAVSTQLQERGLHLDSQRQRRRDDHGPTTTDIEDLLSKDAQGRKPSSRIRRKHTQGATSGTADNEEAASDSDSMTQSSDGGRNGSQDDSRSPSSAEGAQSDDSGQSIQSVGDFAGFGGAGAGRGGGGMTAGW